MINLKCKSKVRFKKTNILKVIYALYFIAVSTNGFAQSAHSYLRDGDVSYKKQDFTAAEEDYRKALEKKNSAAGNYNLGNSIYEQQRYKEAVKHYLKAADEAKDNATKAQAFHNLGNAHFQQKEFDKSVEAYKNALRLNPSDLQTKKNLAMAIRQMQMQKKQQQQQQKNKEGDNSEEKKQQQQQDQKQKDDSQKQQQGKEEKQDPAENAKSQKEFEEKDLNKEEARQLLQIMDQEEQKVQKKLRKAKGNKPKSGKDW